MTDDKESLPNIKDLAFLKNQLENLQWHVEDEVNSRVGQDGSLLSSPFLKGFLASCGGHTEGISSIGLCHEHLCWHLCSSSYAVPNVEMALKDYLQSLCKGPDYL
ncbi:hypothetical protein P7K49_006448 [Saguinus oedipus]|uniref:Uncharacterized protein n=1 Tax=Saguinus oedipus TaxID=9490 RepID=A0ABQ9W644_SAGOE|nr:hypothetical protein P7K49_006448 [Saguinus oedipus]